MPDKPKTYLIPEDAGIEMIQMVLRQGMPHGMALGLEVVAVARNTATLALPYREEFVGDPETGVLHGGVVTTLIDSVCGMALFASLEKLQAIATLDLRIDYLKPAAAHKRLLATAECYKMTRTIAFLRARAYHEEAPDDLIASAAGAFMVGSSEAKPFPPPDAGAKP